MNGADLWLAILIAPPFVVGALVIANAATRKNPAVWCGLLVRLSNAALDASWWFIRFGESCDAFTARWCELKRLPREDSQASRQLKALEGK